MEEVIESEKLSLLAVVSKQIESRTLSIGYGESCSSHSVRHSSRPMVQSWRLSDLRWNVKRRWLNA